MTWPPLEIIIISYESYTQITLYGNHLYCIIRPNMYLDYYTR